MFRICGAELDLIVPLVGEFLKDIGLAYDPSAFKKKQAALMAEGAGFMFVTMDGEKATGMIAFSVAEPIFSEEVWGIENAWYIVPEYRGGSAAIRLLNAYERFSKEQGATKLSMVHINKLKGEQLKKFYEKKGYKDLETHYIKEI